MKPSIRPEDWIALPASLVSTVTVQSPKTRVKQAKRTPFARSAGESTASSLDSISLSAPCAFTLHFPQV